MTQDQLDNLRKAFDAIDTNGSGSIEASEFGKGLEQLGMKMTEEECLAVFKSFDINNDSKLSFEEYKKLIQEAMKAA